MPKIALNKNGVKKAEKSHQKFGFVKFCVVIPRMSNWSKFHVMYFEPATLHIFCWQLLSLQIKKCKEFFEPKNSKANHLRSNFECRTELVF